MNIHDNFGKSKKDHNSKRENYLKSMEPNPLLKDDAPRIGFPNPTEDEQEVDQYGNCTNIENVVLYNYKLKNPAHQLFRGQVMGMYNVLIIDNNIRFPQGVVNDETLKANPLKDILTGKRTDCIVTKYHGNIRKEAYETIKPYLA